MEGERRARVEMDSMESSLALLGAADLAEMEEESSARLLRALVERVQDQATLLRSSRTMG